MTTEEDWRRGLRELAWTVGVEPEYHDTKGQLHQSSVETLTAVLGAMGVPIQQVADVPSAWQWWHERVASTPIEPVISVREGRPIELRLRLPACTALERVRAGLQCEDGTAIDLGVVDLGEPSSGLHGSIETAEWWLTIAGPRPVGYHQLVLDTGRVTFETSVIAAPPAVKTFGVDERVWGAFAPMYALRGDASVREFDRLAEWVASVGGSVMATLPVLATYLGHGAEPYAPSPYTPVSRRFFNEAFLDLDRVTSGALDAETRDELAALDGPGPFDYRRRAALVHRVLGGVEWSPSPVGSSSTMPDLDRYATFRAVAARNGTGWHDWPVSSRSGDIRPRDYDASIATFHRVAQHAMRDQLLGLAASMAGRGQRLYLDLPIGAHPDGFDTWHQPELFAPRVATGAPPDDFFTEGQNWGFPPIVPGASRAQCHEHVRDCLRHHMEIAGILRLDHVMAFHRLYWVPDGMEATAGAYVRYPRDELFGVLAIESQRHDCIVVGEDLGTVPDEVRQAMADHDVLGMYVAEFALPSWEGAELAEPDPQHLASVDTHDTPTFAGFVHGLDIAQRVETELLDVHDAHHEFESRERQVDNLRRFLSERGLLDPSVDDHATLVALLRHLGASDAPCVLVALEDLWGEVQPQNVPGTPVDRPNWVQRFPFELDELAGLPRVKGAIDAIDRSRKEAIS